MRTKKQSTESKQVMHVPGFNTPIELAERRPGRKKKLVSPPLAQELYDGLSDLEKQHFDYFISAIENEIPDKPTDMERICILLAAIEYINTLRIGAEEIINKKTMTVARFHPAPQLRSWMEYALRRTRLTSQKPMSPEEHEQVAQKKALLGLSG